MRKKGKYFSMPFFGYKPYTPFDFPWTSFDTLVVKVTNKKDALKLMDKETYVDKDTKQHIGETANKLGMALADVNPNGVWIPDKITKMAFWEGVFGGKFFFGDKIKDMEEVKAIIDENTAYKDLVKALQGDLEYLDRKMEEIRKRHR